MFPRNNEKAGFKNNNNKKKCKGYELFSPPTNMYKALGYSHQFLALSLKTLISLNTWELGFNYHDPPEVFFTFSSSLCKEREARSGFYEPTHKGIKYADS